MSLVIIMERPRSLRVLLSPAPLAFKAAVGFYRTTDLVLILVVTGCAIATGLVDGTTREIVHAIQVCMPKNALFFKPNSVL